MNTQSQERGYVSGFKASFGNGQELIVETAEEMNDVLRRMDIESDPLSKAGGAEFATLIKSTAGFEESEGFDHTAKVGTVKYLRCCDGCGKRLWWSHPSTGATYCADCNPGEDWGF